MGLEDYLEMSGQDMLIAVMQMELVRSLNLKHRLNNTLTAIGGNAELLASDYKQNPKLQSIITAFAQLTAWIRSLPNFLCEEDSATEVDTPRLVNKVVAAIDDSYPLLAVNLQVKADKKNIYANNQLIYRALSHICKTVIYYGADSTLDIVVEHSAETPKSLAESPRPKNGYVSIAISLSQGTQAVLPARIKAIFEPALCTADQTDEMSLRMAIAKNLIEGSWGALEYNRDKGVAFSIYLPASNGSVGDEVITAQNGKSRQ